MAQARSALLILPLALFLAAPASAQPPQEAIGWYVIDVRGSVVPFSQNVDLAAARGLHPPETPGRGFGIDIGAHVYPLRLSVITFGIGASYHAAAAGRDPGELSPDPDGPGLRKTFTALSPQISFNFGARDGWSYLSGGIGRARLSLYPKGTDPPVQPTANTLNYGGGVRWFTSDRMAFTIDLRFYAMSPIAGTSDTPASPRITQMALNVGVSFR